MTLYTPTPEEACRYAANFRRIPVMRTILSDLRTPIEVMRILKARSRHCYMLESLEESDRWGRCTFMGYEPTLEVTCAEGTVRLTEGNRTEIIETDDPCSVLRKILADYRSPRLPGFPTFTGGLVGYFAYDFIRYAEPNLALDAADEEHFNDFDLMLFDRVICFDNFRQQIVLIANADTSDLAKSYARATEEIEEMADLVRCGAPADIPPLQLESDFRRLFDKEAYCAMVERARRYIRDGDIFQVVLSNRMDADCRGSLFDTYRLLRVINPSPYLFYLSGDDIEIAGSSPETLVKLTGDTLYTFPLAGTRPRGATPEEDSALERELKVDPKECSEHNMLVDLGRNDLGRISRFGTVAVERYMDVLRYSHVMHLGSTVRGTIRKDRDALDAVQAVLPAGTLSGAPKFRACQIINELEQNRRGIYGGAVGYIDFTGNLDTCIAIRIAFQKNGKVFIRSGAGIVADSVPETEFQECINKAQAVVNAVKQSEGGLDR